MEDWIKKPKETVHEDLTRIVNEIEEDRKPLVEEWKRNTELYLGRVIDGFPPGDYAPKKFSGTDEKWLKWNCVRACVDAVTAKLTAQPVVPMHTTEDAPVEVREQARKLDQYTRTIVNSEDAYQEGRCMVKNAGVCGTGVLNTYRKKKDIAIESLHPERILVDPHSPRGTKADEIHYREYFSEAELKARYPKARPGVIENARIETSSGSPSGQKAMKVAVQTIRLPRENEKGRIVIHTDAGTLYDAVWPYERFPYTIMRWQRDDNLWYGLPGVSDIAGCQHEINEVINTIKANLKHLGWSYLFLRKGAQLRTKDFNNNKLFKIIRGLEPGNVVNPDIASEQVFGWVEKNWDRAFEIFGLSQLTATSQKPPGLRSGAALRTYHDIETERFSEMARQRGRAYVDLDWQIRRVSRELYKDNVNYKARERAQNSNKMWFVRSIDWKSVSIEEPQFITDVAPASALSNSPAGRRAEATEMMESNLVDRTEARQIMNWPDLAKADRLANAPLEDLQFTAEHMLATGNYLPPSKYQWLPKGLEVMTSYIMRARIDGDPEDRIKLLEQWITDAEALRKRETKAKIAEQAAMQAAAAAAQQAANNPEGTPGPEPAPPPGAEGLPPPPEGMTGPEAVLQGAAPGPMGPTTGAPPMLPPPGMGGGGPPM